MKADVIKAYSDRITAEAHFPGEAVELTKARFDELSAGGYVKAAKAVKTAKKAPAKGEQ